MYLRTGLALLALLASVGTARAEDARITPRFREHYDLTHVTYPGGDENYGGLSSSVNLLYEKPLEWSVGLVFNPVVPSRHKQLGTINPLAPVLPTKLRIWTYGIEYQHFLLAEPDRYGLFVRAGGAFNVLDNKSLPNRYGGSGYFGIGWEQRLYGIGLSPEIAIRHVVFEKNTQATSFTPSLALRLYFVNEWLEGLVTKDKKGN